MNCDDGSNIDDILPLQRSIYSIFDDIKTFKLIDSFNIFHYVNMVTRVEFQDEISLLNTSLLIWDEYFCDANFLMVFQISLIYMTLIGMNMVWSMILAYYHWLRYMIQILVLQFT